MKTTLETEDNLSSLDNLSNEDNLSSLDNLSNEDNLKIKMTLI